MRLHQMLGVVCVINLLGTSAQAAAPTSIADAINQIQTDSALMSGWTSDQFKRAIPFNSTAGNAVPSQLKVFGVELGVAGVVTGTKVDKDSFHNLGTSVINTSEIDMFDRMPVPTILGQAKIGLPFGLDAGVRLGGIPSTSLDEGDTKGTVSNTIMGIDVRKNLIDEGEMHPFGLTVGVNFTRAKGHLEVTTPYSPNLGSNVTLANAVGTGRTDWDTKSVGLQLMIHKKIPIVTPYLGIGVNKNFGKVDTSITNTGTATYTGPGGGTQSYTTMGTGSSTPNSVDLRGMAGVEISILPFIKLGIGGEVASQNNLAASIGLRGQFR